MKMCLMPETVVLIANGDLRLSANQRCWPAQARVEEAVMNAIRREGHDGAPRPRLQTPRKAMASSTARSTGWKCSASIPPDAPLVVVEAVWQYSHHLLHGLYTHRGPILTVANWSGEWPGLVGMLNLNASLTKAGVPFSTLWSEDFTDESFLSGLRRWLDGEPVQHDLSHVQPLDGAAPAAKGRRRSAPGWRSNCAATRPSWASSTRAAWACTTPSSPTNCCIRPASSRSA